MKSFRGARRGAGRAALLASTALVAFIWPSAAEAAPVVFAFAGTLFGGAASAWLAGSAIAWGALIGQAAVAGVLAGVQMLTAPNPGENADSQGITLNKIQPVTTGLILYGERMLGGSIVARSTTAAGGKAHARYHSVMPLACHEIDGVSEVWLGETLVWTEAQFNADVLAAVDPLRRGHVASPFRHKFVVTVHKGGSDQMAETRYVAAASEWTAAARGRGIAYVYFEADFDPDVYPNGVEQIRVRVRGKRLFDPRDGQVRYSVNPFLALRDYALTPELFGGVGWTAADVDDAAIVAHANLADEIVPLKTGATQKRYAFNGVLDTAASPADNLNRLSTSWGGWWTVDRGRLTVGGGAWEPPVVTITEDDLVGPVRVRAKRAFEDQFNVVKAVYADPTRQFVATDLPVLDSDTYRAQDNGEVLVRDLGELPGETSYARGQRLMKLALLKGRRQRMVDLPCNLSMFRVGLGENVYVDLPRRGWVQKPFEVVGRVVSVSPGNCRVMLSLVENGPAIYDYNTSEELEKPAGGVPSLALPGDRPVAGSVQLTEQLYSTRTGGVKTTVTLSAQTDNPFVDQWEFLLTQNGGVARRQIAAVDSAEFADVNPGIYQIGARCRTRRGLWSEWTYDNGIEVYGIGAIPQPMTGLSYAVVSGIITLRWDQSPDLDVRQGGTIEIRHSGLTGATWQNSTSWGKAVPGGSTMVAGPAMSGTYLIAARDSQGLLGPATAIPVVANDTGTMQFRGNVLEHPAFAGTKTNLTYLSNGIQLATGQVAGTYLSAGMIDLGGVETVRLTVRLKAEFTERSNLFDSSELFDSAALFDGSSAAEGDVTIWYQATNDDPAGAPVWGDWVLFDRTEATGRAFRFKAELTATSANHMARVSILEVKAERRA